MDRDGLKDIITGKTYYSHHEKSPLWDAGAVVYWFRLEPSGDEVIWVPRKAAADTGIGRQITIADVNADELPDILVGGMKGGNVLIQKRESVVKEQWLSAQPEVFDGSDALRKDRGESPEFDKESGRVTGAIEGESMKAGVHKLTLETIGANESAVMNHMVGFDDLRLISQ